MTPQRREKLISVLNKRQDDITIVLENVFDPHNISAVMRTCDAVGVQELYVLNTKIPRHKNWGAKSYSSAATWLTVYQFENTGECFSEIRKKYSKILTNQLSSDAVNSAGIDLTQALAQILGNEHSGAPEVIRNLADGNFIIPAGGIIRSPNISVACAVTLYEAYGQKTIAGHYDKVKL